MNIMWDRIRLDIQSDYNLQIIKHCREIIASRCLHRPAASSEQDPTYSEVKYLE